MTEPGALDGVVVADLSRVLAGPYAAMTLGDLGATVIKVERPDTGDDTRHWGPPWADGQSTYFRALNRNKRSITLDFDDPADRALAVRLVDHADIVIENFRPGSLDRYDLGPAQSLARNPRLVYCSITGFGDSPEARELPGYDLLVQAASGLMSFTGWPDGPPTKVGVALVDHICALQATVGILAALRHRDRTGEGQRVSVSLMGAALAALSNQASGYLGAGVVPGRLGNRHPSIAPYQTFRAADGHLVLACGNDTQFRRVCTLIGRDDLTDDERFATNAARVANVDALEAILTGAFADRAVGDVVEALTHAGVPAGPINDVADAFTVADRLGLGAVDEIEDTDGTVFRSVASPIGLEATPTTVRTAPPDLGEHGDDVRAWLESLDRDTAND